jgi:hypothetical protein
MDRNGDGSVDKKELFSWILRSFRSLSQEESTDRFQDTDDDQVFCLQLRTDRKVTDQSKYNSFVYWSISMPLYDKNYLIGIWNVVPLSIGIDKNLSQVK